MFNPTVKDFTEENKKMTLIGFCWAMQWRFMVAVYGTILVISIVFGLLGKIFS